MKFIIKWIKNNKKISFSIIALLALLIFVLYPGNDITCLDIVPPATANVQSAQAGDVLKMDIPHSEHKLTLIFTPKGSYPIQNLDIVRKLLIPTGWGSTKSHRRNG